MFFQLRETLAALGRNRKNRHRWKSFAKQPEILFRRGKVHFVCDDAPRTFREQRLIQIDLASQALQIFDRVTSFASSCIEHEEQIAAAHDVPEEIMTEPNVAVRAFD